MSHDLEDISDDEEPCVDHYELLSIIAQGTFAKMRLAW